MAFAETAPSASVNVIIWNQVVNSSDLLSDSFVLLVLGMGTVFVFLAMLVMVTTLMSSLVIKYAPPAPAKAPAKTLPPAAGAPPADQTLLAVIGAAIHAHRNKK